MKRLFALLLLVACRGGGSSGSPPIPVPSDTTRQHVVIVDTSHTTIIDTTRTTVTMPPDTTRGPSVIIIDTLRRDSTVWNVMVRDSIFWSIVTRDSVIWRIVIRDSVIVNPIPAPGTFENGVELPRIYLDTRMPVQKMSGDTLWQDREGVWHCRGKYSRCDPADGGRLIPVGAP